MSTVKLTKTRMKQGVWEGVVTAEGADDTPKIEVFHQNGAAPDVSLTHDAERGHWLLRVPIPPEVVADGVHTLVIRDMDSGDKIGHITLLAGEPLGDDLRAEIDLLRAELDMLKRAFRRHCLEGV